jgi:phage gp29-like protein
MPDTPILRKPTREIGASGTIIQNGIISAEEYNRKLSGRQALLMYDIMSRSDADVHGILEVCKLPVLAASWDVQPAKNKDGQVEPKDQEAADFIKRELFHRNIDFDDLLYQALDMLDFGYSVFEKVYELTEWDGQPRLGLSKLAFRKQTTVYAWEIPGGAPGITQRTYNKTYSIPMEKLIVFTNKKRGDNYEGISLLRYVFKDWDMKDKLTLVNALALEKMAVGVPVISEREGATANQNDIDKAEEAMKEFRANDRGYIKTPKGVLVEMMDMKSNTTKDVLPTLQYHKRAIFSSVLATFLDLGGSSGSGSQSLSNDLTNLFFKSEEYIAKTLARVINQQLIKQICDLNYSPGTLPNGYPEVSYGSVADDDISDLATAIKNLMDAGAITADAQMEDVIRTKLGMPQMPEDTKRAYAENQKMKQDAAKLALQPDDDADDTDTDVGTKKKPAPAATTKPDKTKAAITASQDAQRRMIEVIFADED